MSHLVTSPECNPVWEARGGVFSQQFTYGVVSEGKVCGNFAESSPKFAKTKKKRFIASGKGVEIPRKVTENSRKFAENFLQWPFPE